MAKQPKLLDLALERQPVAAMLSFGDPARHIERIKRANAIAICQVQILALAQEAVAAGADILVAQGSEGGGHGASRGLFSLLPEIVDAVGGRALVVAAGGIADGRGLAAALMLGASGILMGTRIYATTEAAGAAEAKERIRAATGDATLRSIVFDISRRNVWPAPFTGRCLRNQHLDAWYGREVDLLRNLDPEAAKYAAAREEANFDIAAVIAGEASGLVHEILPAHEVVERVVRMLPVVARRHPECRGRRRLIQGRRRAAVVFRPEAHRTRQRGGRRQRAAASRRPSISARRSRLRCTRRRSFSKTS